MFKIKTQKKVFVPTGTSDLLINSILTNFKLHGKVLDLGAGTGYVGLKLLKNSKKKFKLYASDISKASNKIIKLNAKLNKLKVDVKSGNLLYPWKGYRFDYIINDVSGVSEEIANISSWFNNVSCKSGKDGTKLTIKILSQAQKYLSLNGVLFFPILSFSKEKKIFNLAKKKFKKVKKIGNKEWILPKEMIPHFKLLEKMKKKGYINFRKKFGLITWTTKIYMAY